MQSNKKSTRGVATREVLRSNDTAKRSAEIVVAARELYEEKGLARTSIQDITNHVGVTRSLFYHYFEDKEAVADAVLDNVIDEILTTLKQWNQARETGNVNKALDDIVHVLRSLIADESPFSNRMIQDATPNCISSSLTARRTVLPTTLPRPPYVISSRCMACQSPTSMRRSSH